MPRAKDCIEMPDCKHGYVYRLRSRNLSIGVYDEAEKGFIGIREKFRHKFLSTEYHWDTGAPHGTASPVEELEKLPAGLIPDLDSHELHRWMLEAEARYFKQDEGEYDD